MPTTVSTMPDSTCAHCGHAFEPGEDKVRDATAPRSAPSYFNHHAVGQCRGRASYLGWARMSLDDFERWEARLTFRVVDQYTEKVSAERQFVRGNGVVFVPRGLAIEGANSLSITEPATFRSTLLGTLPKVPLRDYQLEPVAAILRKIKKDKQTTLVAGCGTGKTCMSLEVVRQLELATLVLVHKEYLLDQWQSRVEQFLPGARVGRWQADIFDIEDKDIVIGMVQSLSSKREYPAWAYAQFGVVIVDEMHRGAAPTWVRAITRFAAPYRLGLSATPKRKDGREEQCFLHVGRPGHVLHHERVRRPRVARVKTDFFTPVANYQHKWNGEVNTSKLISLVCADEERTDKIVGEVARAVRAGRNPLVFTERRAHVTQIKEKLVVELGDGYQVEDFMGGLKGDKLKAKLASLDGADVVVSTFQMGSEALDVAGRDTEFLVAPRTSVEQVTGRIDRPGSDLVSEKDPLIVDFVDARISVLMAYWKRRVTAYRRLKYDVPSAY